MALIEGVGDEVTLLFGSLLLLLVLLLAWISTRTSEPPEHLFTSTTGPAPHWGPAPPIRTPPSSTNTASSSSSSPSSSVSDSSLTEALPNNTSTQEEKGGGREAGEGEAGGGDGIRNRGGGEGGGGGEEEEEESSSSQRSMVVRLKFLNDTERTAQVKPQDTIGYIKRTYFAGQEQQVRLIYQGQLLQDDAQTLASLNLVHNCVLHCHISQHAGRGWRGPRPADQVQVALNVGSLMVPLLVLMLSVLWYCQIQYRQFFTAPATASLVGVTIFLSLVAFGVYRR
ncbi:LOW QUALITY PROTEIN: transmembrane and ubiquitin-like domain-containing protein 1 [Anoplopoma fimbria]|uniref:LOW QUALITY PROTEIN: transmembrane and ubiquitin-like domain-containing protein 1 n=1 Tax=Anoplopoma fimbria TaxID=229290 RepID=UPI0023ED3BB0|nr:LOW QUALITY PROTEIN: transmembrane and ubiquitin-like domain-containing protein 1 [Anoplopoma fimbria]